MANTCLLHAVAHLYQPAVQETQNVTPRMLPWGIGNGAKHRHKRNKAEGDLNHSR